MEQQSEFDATSAALGAALEHQAQAWVRATGQGPVFEMLYPDAEPVIFDLNLQADGEAPWTPAPKARGTSDLTQLLPRLPSPRASLRAYFNSWWFCSLDIGFGEWGLTLEPVMPGEGLRGLTEKYRGYHESFPDAPSELVPLGLEANGDTLLFDNRDGSLFLEYWDTRARTPLTDSLESLLRLVH